MLKYKQIPAFVLEKLRNDTHLEAVTDILNVARGMEAISEFFGEAVAALAAAVAEEKSAMEDSAKSHYTEQIVKKDTERDSALDTVKTLIRSTSLMGSDTQRQAAEFLMSMAKVLKVKTRLQYDQKTGAITVAVDELLGEYGAQTEAAGIKPFVEMLKRANDEMCELLIRRDAGRGAQGKSRVAAMRKRTDLAYRELALQVNALEIACTIGKLPGYTHQDPFQGFIAFMTGLIDRYKREVMPKSGSDDGKDGEGDDALPDPIHD